MSSCAFDLEVSHHPVAVKSLSNIWLLSNLYLRRNFSLFPFTSRMSPEQTAELEDILVQALPAISEGLFAKRIKPEEVGSLYEQALIEYYFSLSSLKKPSKETRYFLSQDGQTVTHLHNEDHLTLQKMQKNPFKSYEIKDLLHLSLLISEKIPLAINEKFGYLTPNTHFCGSALVVEAYLHLPLLLRSKPYEQIREGLGKEVDLVGLNGANGFVGDLAIIRNKVCFGLDEEAVLKKVQDRALKLVEQEQKLRRNHALHHHWYHEVSKAFGALTHGSLFSVVEAFNLLSFLKVGVDLKWVENLNDSQVNQLLLKLRRGYIQGTKNQVLDQDKLGQARAQLIGEALAHVRIKPL